MMTFYFYLVYFLSFWLLRVLVFPSLGLSCLGLCTSWTWLTFLSPVREISSYYLFRYFLESFLSSAAAAAAAKSLQSCPPLCDPIDGSPAGCPVPRILQARTLEWVAISFSNGWKWSRSAVSDSSRPHGLQPTRLLCPWDFPGKSTGVGYHCLLPFSF